MKAVADIKALTGQPAEIAARLDAWVDAHTRLAQLRRASGNLKAAGTELSPFLSVALNAGGPMLLGEAPVADISTGTTRRLATEQGKTVTRPTLDATANDFVVLRAMLGAVPTAERAAVAAAFARRNGGKTLSATLGELVRAESVRAPLMALLAPPVSDATLTYDAFVEQLAVGLVYSNQPAGQMNTDTHDERRGGNPAAILAHFGFKAGPLILGRWGFQMRVFTPVPGKAKWPQPIVAFRGTEGVQVDINGDKAAKAAAKTGASDQEQGEKRAAAVEGNIDTLLGDFSPAQVGWLQVMPNLQLIDANLARLKGKAVSTGHSLGGGIAQLVVAARPAHFSSVVTFQAPAIDQAEVAKVRRYNAGAGKAAPITARHYRVDGDIVPTAGQQVLDGQISYFDRAVRPAGSTVPFTASAAESLVAGHVTPMLTTYARGRRDLSDDLKVLATNGLNDEATLKTKGKQDVRMTFSGSYSTKHDPRLNLEATRQQAAAKIPMVPGNDWYEATVYQNIAYNTLLSHVETIAADWTVTSFKDFQQRCTALFAAGRPLPLDQDDVTMANILKMDRDKGLVSFLPSPPTDFSRYEQTGVPIADAVIRQVRTQLEVIWLAWRGQ
ncbi:hypothetical protein [Deinococcus daejeonensis]|uniref:Fungal lipase-like domain-containing protein n=1 Tax=Deinococcus daejeonensis TaxID=1007098 RepID=A0ABQ2J1L4_9DEIO|nr:hypothetical protein [Deinococcus daejeonensis]GGN34704.1 hypothetical protein GCM10010842_13680 [Deinococcus daejeonensis]